MGKELVFAESVPRWLRLRGDEDGDDPPFDLDDDGFLPDPASGRSAATTSGMIRPEQALSTGALVLLGEPGAGKTTTFTALTGSGPEAQEPAPGTPGTVWITGSELSATGAFTDALGDHLGALPQVGSLDPPEGPLTIVLDQLDEAANVHRLPDRLRRALRGKDTRSLRFLIACRTADYPEALTRVLEQALSGCVVADLAPLTREDVVALVSGIGADATAFVDAITNAGVGTLANLPLTLKVLLAAFERDPGALARGPRELFELGVGRLADEHDRQRAAASYSGTTVDHRLVIASRIATRMVLAGRRTVWCGEYGKASPDDLTEGMLCGGRETCSGDFDVTPAAVAETLKTALFARSGRGRIAFAHSSFAAYLAARYLTTRTGGARSVLRSLSAVFLVAAPDETTASIPTHLRETAAWLLAHSPRDFRWLATADPEGLIAHGAYITDADTRAAMVDGLLRRAAEVELSDRGWHRMRWKLTHEGLAAQLRTVLDHVLRTGSDTLQDFAAASLAIRIARDGVVHDAAQVLLQVAEAESLAPSLRYNAIRAAMTANAETAAPRLRALLASLAEIGDPDEDYEELVGTILSVLWPEHLELKEMLPHMHPLRDGVTIGAYRMHLRYFPVSVAELDIPKLLEFVNKIVGDLLGPACGMDNAASQHYLDISDNETVDGLLTPIFDRVTISPNLVDHLPVLVRQMSRLINASATLVMPFGVDVIDEKGSETGESVKARHALAEALIGDFVTTCDEFGNYHAYLVTSRWAAARNIYLKYADSRRGGRKVLLDNADFPWLVERIDHYRSIGAVRQADAMGHVAASVANLYDLDTFELAYARRDAPEGVHFSWMFDGVRCDSSLAKTMRANDSKEQEWEYSEQFAREQSARLDAAKEGDTDAFWQLAHYLKADPQTGRFRLSDGYDPRTLPGVILWPPGEFAQTFNVAARRFLRGEHDHRDGWLGARAMDYRAEAGYAAFIVLHDNDDLDDMIDRWGAWVGVILDKAHRVETRSDSSLVRELMRRAVAHAPAELGAAVRQLVAVSLSRGASPWALAEITSMLPTQVHATLVNLADDVREAVSKHSVIAGAENATDVETDPPPGDLESILLPATVEARSFAIRTWGDLLREPVATGNGAALEQAEQVLAARGEDDQADFAVAAGKLLLVADPGETWPRLREAVTASTGFARELAMACAPSRHGNDLADALSDESVEEVWRWLADVAPPDTDVWSPGFEASGRPVHEWRDSLLTQLAQRGTPQAVLGIRRLAELFPGNVRVQSALIAARRRAQARATIVPSPKQVIELLIDPDRRVVRTAAQLADLIVETLTEVQRDLYTHSNLLWNRERDRVPPASPSGTRRPSAWRPKSEGSLAAYLAHELQLRLTRRTIVINREVVIKPTDDGDSGERPDLLVEAIALDAEIDAAETVSVPIEIKGSWHKDVLSAQCDQLAARYLPASQTDTGVYVVGWYPLDQWDAEDGPRKSRAAKFSDVSALLDALQRQARTILSAEGKRTLPVVLRVERASAELEAGHPLAGTRSIGSAPLE
ncbi:hypothetical protein L3Q67_25480 [Saccharothrix sp. AJ9571]|nr:hypothetical protein L3Q67_25480 [Saccharothrix sp. AJ9571]